MEQMARMAHLRRGDLNSVLLVAGKMSKGGVHGFGFRINDVAAERDKHLEPHYQSAAHLKTIIAYASILNPCLKSLFFHFPRLHVIPSPS